MGTVLGKPILFQIAVVTIVSLLATIGVYGIVALIVRMDDLGYKLIKLGRNKNNVSTKIGNFLIRALPVVIKSLSVIGTIALILVAGGIFTHNIELLHHILEHIPTVVKDFIFGILVGFIAFLIVELFKKVYQVIKKAH